MFLSTYNFTVVTRKKILNRLALNFNQNSKSFFTTFQTFSNSLLWIKPYLFTTTTNAQPILTMPKCSKYDYKPTKTFKWKSCPHCHQRATNNVAKKCLGCPYVFPVVKNDKRGKSRKRCIRCNTMAKGNRSHTCHVCGSTEYVKGKTPTRAPCNTHCNAPDDTDWMEGMNVADVDESTKDHFFAMLDLNNAGMDATAKAQFVAMLDSAYQRIEL